MNYREREAQRRRALGYSSGSEFEGSDPKTKPAYSQDEIPGWVFVFILGPLVLVGGVALAGPMISAGDRLGLGIFSAALLVGPALMIYPLFRMLFRRQEGGRFLAALASLVFSGYVNAKMRKKMRD